MNGQILVGTIRTRLMYKSREAMAANWTVVFPDEILPDDHIPVKTEKLKTFLETMAKPQRGRSAAITNAAIEFLKDFEPFEEVQEVLDQPVKPAEVAPKVFEEVQIIRNGNYEQYIVPAKPEKEEQKEEEAILPLKTRIRRGIIDAILFSIVVAHAGLIWYDCSDLWGMPGKIGGGVVFLVVLAALLLASDNGLTRTSNNAVWFIFFVDMAAWKVHFEVFKTPLIEDYITASLCLFICTCSFMALWLFRDSKIF